MFMNNVIAKVWELKRYDSGAVSVRISTSSKDQEGEYKQDFSSWVRVGKKTTCINELEKDCTIKLVSVGVKNSYKKEDGAEKGVTTWEPWIFDAVIWNSQKTNEDNGETAMSANADDGFVAPPGIDEELPFN